MTAPERPLVGQVVPVSRNRLRPEHAGTAVGETAYAGSFHR